MKFKFIKRKNSDPTMQDSIVAEENQEIQDSIAADDSPEIQDGVTAENNSEAQDSIVDNTPENQDSSNEQQDNVSGTAKNIFLIKKKPWTLAKKIIVSVSSVVVIAALIGGLFYLSLSVNPLGGFQTVAEATFTPMPTLPPEPSSSEETPSPTPVTDPYEILKATADFSMLKDTVNILLIGVDHGEERDTAKWKGKTDWHSDVMIVLSINTKTNKVSLISLPRDTYAKIPGVTGIYKLNAAINCGGGWPKPEAFEKVCEAASWMIGGIPIQHYYAVDFNAVKDLVDAIGGVDNFDLEITFKINGRRYEKGVRHMDGQAALDYMRVRHGDDITGTGNDTDLKRINRQKKMLVAIFDKLKSTGNISAIPNILGAFDGNLYTNVSIDQTAGLAAYAYKNIDPKTIGVYSMGGSYNFWLFDWHFVITDLNNRVNIIKNVYGIDISKDKQFKGIYNEYKKYSHSRAWSLWFNMQTEVALKKSRSLLDKAKKILDDDAVVTPKPSDDPSTPPSKPPVEPPPSAPPTTDPPKEETTGLSSAALFAGSKYGDAERQLYATAESEYAALKNYDKSSSSDKRKELIAKFKADVQALCKALSIKVSTDWDNYWKVKYYSRKNANQRYVKNEVYVDFN